MRADAFNHHHGLLQQHQFDPCLHVEQRGDLEEEGQEFRHRDLVGGARMDRFADGPDGLREILDLMDARHVAGLEMHLGDPAVISLDEAIKDFSEKPPLV